MQEYTITEASAKLSVTKETLHAWLVDAEIAPRQSTQDKRRKVITQEELQQIAKKHKRAIGEAVSVDPDSVSADEYAALLRRVERLERIVTSRAESRASTPPAPIASYLPPAPVSTPESTYTRSQEYAAPVLREVAPPVDVPAGSIMAVDFARAHSVSPTTLKSQIRDQRPDLGTQRDTGAKNGRQEQWISPSQQEGVIALWESRHTSFSTCTRPSCPCRKDA